MKVMKMVKAPPCSSDINELGFSVDLLKSAKEHIFFLQRLHPHFIQRPSHKSLQRYRDLWLPLVRTCPTLRLAPPPDVAWFWHCHRLAPFRYTSYLRARYGKACPILEANPPFCFQQPDGKVCIAGEEKEDEVAMFLAEETKKRWDLMFPNEPFFLASEDPLPSSHQYKGEKKADSVLLDGFDLLASTDRQATFLWQVSGPRFSEVGFLRDAISQYHKFLKLREQATAGMVLVPTYQIDLMWHSHILANVAGYFIDCKEIMGSTLDGPLDRAFTETKDLWRKNYGEEYFAEGGMYRGDEPPVEYYSPSWDAVLDPQQLPTGLFLHLIDIQGASSTNPTSGGDWDPQVIWTWKETASQMSKHAPSDVVGDPADCWVKYNDSANRALETAFAGKLGVCDMGNGYHVNFTTMKQTKSSTGYQRDVQRHIVAFPIVVKPVIWCWKETSIRMPNHPASSVVGDPADCWIKYDVSSMAKLEGAFQAQGSKGECEPIPGYVVNFRTMKQKKLSTGYEREVQRVDQNASSYQTSGSLSKPIWYWRSLEASNNTAPHGCWVKYGDIANTELESAFQAQGQCGKCIPMPGYQVDFMVMKQTNISTGNQRDVQRVDGNVVSASQVSWTPWTGTAPDGLPAFVSANEKSTTRGLNANPLKSKYIFGKKSTSTGYYHISTKEAYEIMAARIGVRLQRKQSQSMMLQGLTLGMMSKKKKVQELKDIQAIALARASSQTPTGVVGLRAEIQNDPSKRNKHYSAAGDWYFPQEYYLAAGGCGAGTVRGGGAACGAAGGGCGALACGAGGCGAAACGGGGCGGGGCGGGGCGG